MKRTTMAALVATIAMCVVLIMMPDAHAAAVGSIASVAHHIDYNAAGLVLAVGLDALRSQHAELTTRAAAKIAEVKDGLAEAQIRSIETDHAAIVADIATVAAAITTEERRLNPNPQPTDPNVAARAAVEAERTRVADITELATRHAMPAAFAPEHVRAGTAIGEVRSLVLNHVAAEAAKRSINPRSQIGTDAAETLRNSVEAAIMLRANPQAIRPDTEPARVLIASAREFRGMSLLEIGRTYVEDVTGRRLRGMSKMDMAGQLLGLNGGLGQQRDAGGMMSTSDFPSILANVITKRLRSAYEVAPQNWKQISRQSNAPDFKSKYVVQLSNMPNLKEVKEGGEYQYASLTDGKETYNLVTYGRVVPVTRQALINDDLGAFDRIPMLMGRAAAETEAAIVWGIITANGAMSDTIALFHASHANLAGSGSAITIASLNAARSAMRKQKGLAKKAADAEPLNLTPKFLVVSPDKETEAQQFLATMLYPATAGNVNPFAGLLTQITEARLTGNTWYVFADPAQIDTIEYAYLEGEEGLYTETRFGFEVDGIEVKGRLDFAAKAIDWRGMYKDPGA